MGPSFSSLVYKLHQAQQLRLVELLREFAKEGTIESTIYENIDYFIDDIESTIDYDIKTRMALDAASLGMTTIEEENWGVHSTHCCLMHGCKYGRADCPVILELTKQVYPCEDCNEDNLDI